MTTENRPRPVQKAEGLHLSYPVVGDGRRLVEVVVDRGDTASTVVAVLPTSNGGCPVFPRQSVERPVHVVGVGNVLSRREARLAPVVGDVRNLPPSRVGVGRRPHLVGYGLNGVVIVVGVGDLRFASAIR